MPSSPPSQTSRLRLLHPPNLDTAGRILTRLPRLEGAPIRIRLMRDPRNHKGRLAHGAGTPVHAASFLRQRLIVLDSGLVSQPLELARILIHELFHFAWWRLGNRRRAAWRALLESEARAGARGELGWSAERLKSQLPRHWPGYACESFCDSAAWLWSGFTRHDEFTLARRHRDRRRRWLFDLTRNGALRV